MPSPRFKLRGRTAGCRTADAFAAEAAVARCTPPPLTTMGTSTGGAVGRTAGFLPRRAGVIEAPDAARGRARALGVVDRRDSSFEFASATTRASSTGVDTGIVCVAIEFNDDVGGGGCGAPAGQEIIIFQ